MTSSHRYAIADLPAGRVRVVVGWEAREFVAARLQDSKGHWRWAEMDMGEIRFLPPKGKAGRGWAAEPDWWRPLDAATWGLPLPPPLPDLVRPQFVSQSGSRKWRAMAEQAAQSDAARAALEAEIAAEESVKPAPQDIPDLATQITYSPAGSISREEALARVCRAILTDGAMTTGNPFGLAAAGDDEVRRERFEPTRADRSDYLTAYAWFAALQPPEERPKDHEPYAFNAPQRLLARHARGASLRAIAKAESLGHPEIAKRLLAAVVDAVHRIANGGPLHLYRRPIDHMAAVRGRNRSYRRQA